MRHPIQRQLLIPLLTAQLTVVIGIAFGAVWVNIARTTAELDARRNEVVAVLQNARFPLSGTVLEQMSHLSGHHFIVWNPGRDTFAESSLGLSPQDLDQAEPQLRAALRTGSPLQTLMLPQGEFFVVATQSAGQPNDVVLVLTSQASVAAARWDAIWPPLAIGGGTLLLLIPWLLAVTRGWSRRIGAIQQQVAEIARGNPVAPEPLSPRHDELSALMADIATMDARLRELQQENLQLERERLVAQLAAGFAHQFRNAAAGVSLALQLHVSRCQSPRDGSLDVALKQLALLEAEVRGILSLGRKTQSPHEPLLADSLLDDAVDLISPSLKHHGIRVDREPDATHSRVMGARDSLLAALLNLLLNAIDAAGPQGTVQLDIATNETSAAFVVRDNGRGPPPEIASRLAEPFVTSKPDGVGLGLAIVTEVARAHGGHLDWRRDGDWTTMELWIPRATLN